MKTTMIAALVAAQLMTAASPARSAETPREAAEQALVELAVADPVSEADPRAESDRQEEPRKKKRKSTGDKVLTGAAVVLGVGALAVGGLLVAFFIG
jgi:hypothetical protein